MTQDTLAYPPKAKTEASLQTSEADIIIYGLKKEGKAREEVHFVPGESCSPQGPILQCHTAKEEKKQANCPSGGISEIRRANI